MKRFQYKIIWQNMFYDLVMLLMICIAGGYLEQYVIIPLIEQNLVGANISITIGLCIGILIGVYYKRIFKQIAYYNPGSDPANHCPIMNVEGIDYVQQTFHLLPGIQNQFFIGDNFVGWTEQSTQIDVREMMNMCDLKNLQTQIFPEIVNGFGNICGKGNWKFSGFAFQEGNSGVLLYFHIRKAVYTESMKKIEGWLKYEEAHDLVRYDEHKID